MEFIVKKLGWENAAQIHNSAHNIYDDFVAWKIQAVVVSAMRSPNFNTTDKLIDIWKELSNKCLDVEKILDIIDSIERFHFNLLECDLLCWKEKLNKIVKKLFLDFRSNIKYYINSWDWINIPTKNNDYSIVLENGNSLSIIGFGEIISSKIISGVINCLSSNAICSESVDLWNIVCNKDLKDKSDKDIFDMLTLRVSNLIDEKIIWWHIPVLSGYMWSFEEWIEKRIWRWYSDATAAISTVWLARKWHLVTLEIQKSVKWLMSADPRILDNPEDAVVIKETDYLTAREITGDNWAQAKLLHPQALRSEVQEAGIKIHLFDPFSWEDWTWIINNESNKKKISINESWIRFVWWRKNIIFFSVSSWKMFEKSILSRLFWIVKDYFSVDIIISSETEVSFTIDWNWVSNDLLDELVSKIREEFDLHSNSKAEFVEYKRDRALIFCVGDHMNNYIKLLWKSMQIFAKNDIDIRLISQWRLERAIIFGIEEKNMNKTVNLLHKEFITWNTM